MDDWVSHPISLFVSNAHTNNLTPIIQESIHASVKGGMKYNTGRLLMVLHKPLIPTGNFSGGYAEDPEMESRAMLPMPWKLESDDPVYIFWLRLEVDVVCV